MEKGNIKKSNIYKYFEEYTKEEIDEVIKSLPSADKDILHKRLGDNFEEPVWNILPQKEAIRFNNIYDKIKKKLVKFKSEDMPFKLTNEENECVSKQMITNLQEENIVTPKIDLKEEVVHDEITKTDYINILEVFNTKEFIEMTKIKSPLECTIISLKLGYVLGQFYSSSAIANFLNIEVSQVDEIFKNCMLEYKYKLSAQIDEALKRVDDREEAFVKKIGTNYGQIN